MAAIVDLIGKHEKLAADYAREETSYAYNSTKADGTHNNPNSERARQSKIAHQETAAWLRVVAAVKGEHRK